MPRYNAYGFLVDELLPFIIDKVLIFSHRSQITQILYLMERNSYFVEHFTSFTIEAYPKIEINNKNV